MSAGTASNVVVVDRDAKSLDGIRSVLTQIGTRVAGETDNLATGLSMVKGLRPDILILDLPNKPESALEAIQRLKNQMPEMGIILTSNDASPQLILRCMRAGAQEFLPRPLNLRELGEAVNRLSARAVRAGTVRRQPGKVIAVFSNKGGVGVTSIATNLAASFSVNSLKTTALVDLNMQMAEVSLHLDLRPKYTLAEALNAGTLDESRLKGLLTEHACGLSLLSTPEDPIESEMITPGLLIETFVLLKSMFDVIVVDAGHLFDSRVLEVLNLADCVLVVAGLDVPTVRNTHRCLVIFDQLGFTKDKLRLLVNREQKKSKVMVEDLERLTGVKVFWQLPSDYQALISAIDAGVPAVLQDPKAKISKNIRELTDALTRVLEGTPEISNKGLDPVETGRGFFKTKIQKAG